MLFPHPVSLSPLAVDGEENETMRSADGLAEHSGGPWRSWLTPSSIWLTIPSRAGFRHLQVHLGLWSFLPRRAELSSQMSPQFLRCRNGSIASYLASLRERPCTSSRLRTRKMASMTTHSEPG